MDCRQVPVFRLACLELFDGSAAFLEQDTVTTVRASDIHVNLNLLLATGALV